MVDYIKYSLRILRKNALYTAISIFGLAVGITCCILIGMFVNSEISYDNFHPEKEKIYRINTIGGGFTAGLTSFGIAPTLKKDNPEVADYCRYLGFGNFVDVQNDKLQFNEPDIILADSNFFSFFGFELLKGSKSKVISNPQTVVLSESMASKYFGDEDPINKSIKINKKPYQVTGIVQDCPDNTDIRYQAICSINSVNKDIEKVFYEDWYRVVCFAYLKFTNDVSANSFKSKLDTFSEKYVKPWGETNDIKIVDYYQLKNIEDVHFDNVHDFDSPKGNKNYIYIFSSVALFIIIIACINFINLSLAQSTKRAKEIGVKKTLGSTNFEIKKQFLIETFIITAFAFFIGLVMIEFFLPTFNILTFKNFIFRNLISLESIITLSFFVILIALLSGLYPAFILSRFSPMDVLNGGKSTQNKSIGFVRIVLLSLQFVFSISMIICSLLVYNQMSFMKDKDLGFDKEKVLVFNIPNDTVVAKKMDAISSEISSKPFVDKVAFSSTLPGSGYGELMFRVEQNDKLVDAQLKLMSCDENFIDLLGIQLIDGENFNKKLIDNESTSYIINEAAVAKFGWKNPIGKRMQWGLLPNGKAEHDGKVVGIVKNFHFQSLHNKIAPMAIQFRKNRNLLSVKLQSGFTLEQITNLKEYWQEQIGNNIMETFFLDKSFNQQYRSEEKMLKIFNYFTIISLILAVLGLFALTSFTIKQRGKEIGVRKILGASTNNIILLLSKDFLIILLISTILGTIPSYYFINEWLNTFSYRIDLSLIPVLISALVSTIIIITIVVYNIASMNRIKPIHALKTE